MNVRNGELAVNDVERVGDGPYVQGINNAFSLAEVEKVVPICEKCPQQATRLAGDSWFQFTLDSYRYRALCEKHHNEMLASLDRASGKEGRCPRCYARWIEGRSSCVSCGLSG